MWPLAGAFILIAGLLLFLACDIMREIERVRKHLHRYRESEQRVGVENVVHEWFMVGEVSVCGTPGSWWARCHVCLWKHHGAHRRPVKEAASSHSAIHG